MLEGRDITETKKVFQIWNKVMQIWNKVMQIWSKVMQIWETNTTRCQHYHISKLLRPPFGILCLLSSSLRLMTFPGVQLRFEHRNCCKGYTIKLQLCRCASCFISASVLYKPNGPYPPELKRKLTIKVSRIILF